MAAATQVGKAELRGAVAEQERKRALRKGHEKATLVTGRHGSVKYGTAAAAAEPETTRAAPSKRPGPDLEPSHEGKRRLSPFWRTRAPAMSRRVSGYATQRSTATCVYSIPNPDYNVSLR